MEERELLKEVDSLYCTQEEAEQHYNEYLEATKKRNKSYYCEKCFNEKVCEQKT